MHITRDKAYKCFIAHTGDLYITVCIFIFLTYNHLMLNTKIRIMKRYLSRLPGTHSLSSESDGQIQVDDSNKRTHKSHDEGCLEPFGDLEGECLTHRACNHHPVTVTQEFKGVNASSVVAGREGHTAADGNRP